MTFTKQITPAVRIDEFCTQPARVNYGYVGNVRGSLMVTVTTDDGFEEILSCQFPVKDEAEGVDYLEANGYALR